MLVDSFTRQIRYLRLSITDVCNFRCVYCLPNGYQKPCHSKRQLERAEIRRLIQGFAELGVKKIRITGGEPSLRPDFLEVARDIRAIAGIEVLALTSNGFRLSKRVRDYYSAGFRQLNISIDSLRPERFKELTGRDHLDDILDGLEIARSLPFQSIKVNTLLTKQSLSHDMPGFTEWLKDRDISIRFIEIMPTANNLEFRKANYIAGKELRRYLVEYGWQPLQRNPLGGPAEVYGHEAYQGTIGLIAPYDDGFCSTCNRVRINAYGEIRLCLWDETQTDLKPLLQSDDQAEALKDRLITLLHTKPEKHSLQKGQFAANPSFSMIGG